MNEKMTVNENDVKGFFRTLASNDLEGIRELIQRNPGFLDSFDRTNFGATPLTMACFGRRREVVELLIELGADPNRKSDWHMGPWSPLHCAAFNGDRSLTEFLVSHGATLDVHSAASMGDCDAVSRLLDAEPQRVAEQGGDGCQPLHFADSIAVAELLLVRGACIDARCLDHYSTPIQYRCTARPDVARYLAKVGAKTDIFSSAICNDCSSIEKIIKVDPSQIHSRINQSFFPPSAQHDVHNIMTFSIGHNTTPLHAAAMGNSAEAVRLLVRSGAVVNARGGYDQATPLHTAAWNNCRESALALLESGSEIEARSGNIHNNTSAGWAIVAGADRVFELLMQRGAERHPWFQDDARDGCAGRFDQVSRASREQRERILAWL